MSPTNTALLDVRPIESLTDLHAQTVSQDQADKALSSRALRCKRTQGANPKTCRLESSRTFLETAIRSSLRRCEMQDPGDNLDSSPDFCGKYFRWPLLRRFSSLGFGTLSGVIAGVSCSAAQCDRLSLLGQHVSWCSWSTNGCCHYSMRFAGGGRTLWDFCSTATSPPLPWP